MISSRASFFAARMSVSRSFWSWVTFPPPLVVIGVPAFDGPRFRDGYCSIHRVTSVSGIAEGRSAWMFGGRPLRADSFSQACKYIHATIDSSAAWVGDTPNTDGRAESRVKWMI